jgi:hypothetical protein
MQRTPNKKQGVRLFKPVFFARYSGRRMPVIDSSDGSKTPFSVNSASGISRSNSASVFEITSKNYLERKNNLFFYLN